jgi:hypothetical protein
MQNFFRIFTYIGVLNSLLDFVTSAEGAFGAGAGPEKHAAVRTKLATLLQTLGAVGLISPNRAAYLLSVLDVAISAVVSALNLVGAFGDKSGNEEPTFEPGQGPGATVPTAGV